MDGQFQSETATRHSTYLIGTPKNRHRGPLSRSGSDVPAQQLSRYAGAAVWPAGRRPDDNLPAAGQPNSRVRARRCIQRPEMVRWARGRARKVKRWRRTCARTSSPPPNSSPNLCPAWKPGCGDAESNHAVPPTDRDRCAAVDTPEDGLPDALSGRQAYGKPLYHGLGAGRQAAQRCARGGERRWLDPPPSPPLHVRSRRARPRHTHLTNCRCARGESA